MDNVKIRLKLAGGEFEAEGPDPLVRAHLAEFKGLLTAPAAPTKTPPETTPPTPLDLVYAAEKGLKTLTLRILPSTDQGVLRQIANTLLLILYGFQETLATQEVPVLAATDAIRQSGLVQVNRLSNAFLLLQRDGLAMKLGVGKGTRYQLTAKGQTAAETLIQNTLRRAGL